MFLTFVMILMWLWVLGCTFVGGLLILSLIRLTGWMLTLMEPTP